MTVLLLLAIMAGVALGQGPGYNNPSNYNSNSNYKQDSGVQSYSGYNAKPSQNYQQKSNNNYQQNSYNQKPTYNDNSYDAKPAYNNEYRQNSYEAKPAGYNGNQQNSYNARLSNYSGSGSYGSESEILQRGGVLVASGEDFGVICVPDGTEYYVNAQYDLIRSDPEGPFKRTQVKVAGNVKYAQAAGNGIVWFVDMEGCLWRVKYREAPEKAPNQPAAKFSRVSPFNYDRTDAVTESGDIWYYITKKWIKNPLATNVFDIRTGTDATSLYVDKNLNIFRMEWEILQWVPFEIKGKDIGVGDIDHILVIDPQCGVKKKVYGQFVDIPEKCCEVYVLTNSYYCTTPAGEVKLVSY